MDDKERKGQFTALWARAMTALARREHSCHELRQKFRSKAPADLINEVIEALLKDGLISDERFAHMLCRSRFNRGVGPVRIEYELNQHQIATEWVEQVMAVYEHEWVEHLRSLRIRKYGEAPPVDYRAWAKEARFFQGKGFTSAQIHQAIPG